MFQMTKEDAMNTLKNYSMLMSRVKEVVHEIGFLDKEFDTLDISEPPQLISGEQKSNGRLRSSVSGRFRRIETFQIQNYLKGYSQCYRSPCFHLGMPSGFQNYPQGKDRSQC